MSRSITVRDRHKARRFDTRLLRKIVLRLTRNLLASSSFELHVYVVASPEMCRLNETFLRHRGSTDVLAFNYNQTADHPLLLAEIFVCLDEALVQARRFRTTWQSELVRYVIHGLLHLTGHDDHHPARRHKMKLHENRLLKQLSRQFNFAELERRKP